MGYIYISEYTNGGALDLETPEEPAIKVQFVQIGNVSEPLHKDTRLVVMTTDYPCMVKFFDDTGWDGENFSAADGGFYPVPEGTEVIRLVHLNTTFRIATVRG